MQQTAHALLGHVPKARVAVFLPFLTASGEPIDQGIALYFPSPHSFTGEDVLELQGHGGPVVLDLIVKRVCELGARPAKPGEFTQRAFLNDRMDLAQAEAVADLIESATAEAARAALHSLRGEFSTRVEGLVEGLIRARVYVESAIDFPEEEIDFLADAALLDRLEALRRDLDEVRGVARQGVLLRDGMRVAIAGRPNVGKSSILNRLAGRESAIVTNIPGTTRDVLRETIDVDGMPLHVVDTAGLRDSDDPVEREGVRRAWVEIECADRVLLVVDDRNGIGDEERGWLEAQESDCTVSVIRNKADLTGRAGNKVDGPWGPELHLSALTGDGIEILRAHLEECMGYRPDAGEGLFMARRRHLAALARAAEALSAADVQLRQYRAGELAADELRVAQFALSEITGAFTSDDLLGRIFASFCIGK